MEAQVLPPDNGGSPTGPEGDQDPNGKKPKQSSSSQRRRTKTGCLTCRKRRIKCDEGRPICNNCTKSKRACEGYSQKAVFKGSQPFQDAYGQYAYTSLGGHAGHRPLAPHPGRPLGQQPLPMIAPKPPNPANYPRAANVQHHAQPFTPSFTDPDASLPAGAGSSSFPSGPAALAGQFDPASYPYHSHSLEDLSNAGPSLTNTAYIGSISHEVIQDIPATASMPAAYPQASDPQLSSDEDASMWDSEEEENPAGISMVPVVHGSSLQRPWDSVPRYFSSYTHNNKVGQYMSTPHATELQDDAKRKLFEHFIRVTGPTMSLYERHHYDVEEKDLADAEPVAGRNIWTYTMPLLSMQHPGLLHAILALSSLQVSKMQETPPTAAHKHYHIALRRVAKNVGSYTKRLQLANVAAMLLLSYFEVWNSDHTKWCSHLYGTKILFAEMPLRTMAKKYLPYKSLKAKQKIMKQMGLGGIGMPLPQDPNMVDFELLSTISGFHVTAKDYGLDEDEILRSAAASTTDKDADKFENLRDLLWWFCKLDAYQAILGGAKPFMDYEDWIQVPPRAPISRLDCVYGTYDHLMLLLARVATFNSKDMERKKKAREKSTSPPSGVSPPPFPGMLPTKPTVPPPRGFSPPANAEEQGEGDKEEKDPAELYRLAIEEWNGFRRGLEAFENALGPDFRPLGPEFTDRRDRPFGQAIQYRTYSVAGIWMNYYAALISLHRSHPDMPSAAMPAAGASARHTAVYANLIGRIAVGLSGGCSDTSEISTVLAAAFLESTFCLFVAAIQYQDDEQRKWIVQWMEDITRLTGWQSARQIAVGCESMWIKTAQMGRGPPYERSVYFDVDSNVNWDTSRRIERRIYEADRGAKRVVVARADRAHYALGLLGVEEDMEVLELRDVPFSTKANDDESK